MEQGVRRIGNLFDRLVSFENLYGAAGRAMKGSKGKREASRFFFHLESELFRIQKELDNRTYTPGAYHYFKVYEPKERIISVAPFRDRVVHHALVSVLEPIYEKVFIFDSYATRKDKGTHRAIARAQSFLQQKTFYLKADIEKYFPSMDHAVLLQMIGRKIKDKKILWLVERIVKNSGEKGLPIGNLTSQFFANVYLDAFDHYIKDTLGLGCYLRYMDDFVVFSNNKAELKTVLKKAELFLHERLHLRLKQRACRINTRLHGLSFLGVRIFPSLIRVRRENLGRTLAKIKHRQWQLALGYIDEEECSQSLMSLIGHLQSYNTHELMRSMLRGQLS